MILEVHTFVIQCDICGRKLDPVVIESGWEPPEVKPPESWSFREHSSLFLTQYLCCPSCRDLKLPEER